MNFPFKWQNLQALEKRISHAEACTIRRVSACCQRLKISQIPQIKPGMQPMTIEPNACFSSSSLHRTESRENCPQPISSTLSGSRSSLSLCWRIDTKGRQNSLIDLVCTTTRGEGKHSIWFCVLIQKTFTKYLVIYRVPHWIFWHTAYIYICRYFYWTILQVQF